MILFVFEGAEREPKIFKTLERLFFGAGERIVCSFGNNIYELYRQLTELDGDGDIVSVLRENNAQLPAGIKSSDFSEIYFFFDYDFQNTNLTLEEMNGRMREMLELFDDEIDITKKQITAEAVIAHLMFSTEDYDRLGAKIKCNPSVKSVEDREALREALALGPIDVVATDHAPHLLREKEGGALKALSGMPMIQFSLVSMLELCDQGYFPIERVVELMCHNPALLFRIDRRGFIRKGYYADLVLLNPTESWLVGTGRFYTKCGWTPMDEHIFKWRVARTFVNGKTAYADGGMIEGVRGKAIRFN